MSDAISSVLSQIRSLQSQTQGWTQGIAAPGAAPLGAPVVEGGGGAERVSFSDALKQAVSRVNDAQNQAGELRTAFELGDPSVDLTRVMLAGQEAQIGFQAVLHVRNKLVQAYQDIMNMPV
ncbi:MAG TPA: flagellar hook-basal body complex protein FliE [Arenimonas sp.]|nr:flagellar hook-basal body complex protein FliE [Arenimonas sp.]